MESDVLTKWVTVRCPPAQAYQVFTSGISRWWPLASHSVFEELSSMCVFETNAGGRIFEVCRDGGEALWGTVMVSEPGHRLVFTWHPGRSPTTAQEITVQFYASEGGTRVELRHDGWAALGATAEHVRKQYLTGWDDVLARYVERANRFHGGA